MLTYNFYCGIISPLINLGIAQMVARYLGVVEAVGSNPATQTKGEDFCPRLLLMLSRSSATPSGVVG